MSLPLSQILFFGSLAVLILCAIIQWFKNLPVLKAHFDRKDLLSAWMVYVPFGRSVLFFTRNQTYNTSLKYILLALPYLLIALMLIGRLILHNTTLFLIAFGFFTLYVIEMGTTRDKFFKENDIEPFNPALMVVMIAAIVILIGSLIVQWVARV